MDTRNVSPGVIVAVIVIVVAIASFLLYRGTAAKAYTGPPIDMGAAMRAGHANPAGATHGPATAPGR